MIFAPNSDRLREDNDCHNPAGPGGGRFCASDHAGIQAFVAKYPKYAPEIEAFGEKYGAARLQADVDDFWSNQRKGSGVPSYEFQTQVMQGGNKRQQAERRAAKKAAAGDIKKQVVEQLAQRGLKVGDTMFDRETGTRGVIKIGRDGRPYVQSAMGKHLFGVRWQK